MSAFWAVCPACGERYFHCYVGRTLYSGHSCDRRASDWCKLGHHEKCDDPTCECQCHELAKAEAA